MNIIDNDLLSMQEARILTENAREAQKSLATFSQEKLDEIVFRMLEVIEEHSKELARMAFEETDLGKINDKLIKDKFIITSLRSKLKGMKCVGVIGSDEKNKTMDIGVPVGVIAAFCPETSPVSTIIYNATIAIKSGNAIVFALHSRAKKVMKRTLDILIRAAEGYGLPEGALSYLSVVSDSGSKELVNHKDISLIINTGVLEILDFAKESGKPMIYGGNGNGPAFIERSADIKKAVRDIIDSKTFDNGVVSGAEQSIVVDSPIAEEVKNELIKNGAYFMTEEEAKALGKILFDKYGKFEKEFLGKSPEILAKRAGFNIKPDVNVLISNEKVVSLDNSHSKERLCPVLSFYIENDWMNACEKCIELLLSERQGHTLVIHSKDNEVVKQFALKKPVGRILVNTSGVFGSMGGTTNLFPSMTLGSGSVGKGMTSDNVSPMNLVYVRKVGFETRSGREFLESLQVKENVDSYIEDLKKDDSLDNVKLLQGILKQILKETI
ncbi:MAG: aldehyde dehydrogenase family protein [Clostridium sp.]